MVEEAKVNMVEEASIEFRLRKIDETKIIF